MRAIAQHLKLWLLIACLAAAMPARSADDFPSRPIRLVVGGAPGSPPDIYARLIGTRIAESTKQPVIVENRPGASGSIAAEYVARAPADGYTALVGGSSELMIYPIFGGMTRYDAEKDFTPVAVVVRGFALLLANAGVGVKTVAELIARVRQAPDAFACGNPGQGSMERVACAWIAKEAGIDLKHVPYKGGGAAALGAASGEVQVLVGFPSSVEKQYVAPGRLVPLAVLGPARLPAFADTPTIAEAGLPGLEFPGWASLFVPAGTPGEAVMRLNGEVRNAMRDPALVERVRLAGGDSPAWDPAQVGDFIRLEREKWTRAKAATGIRIDE